MGRFVPPRNKDGFLVPGVAPIPLQGRSSSDQKLLPAAEGGRAGTQGAWNQDMAMEHIFNWEAISLGNYHLFFSLGMIFWSLALHTFAFLPFCFSASSPIFGFSEIFFSGSLLFCFSEMCFSAFQIFLFLCFLLYVFLLAFLFFFCFLATSLLLSFLLFASLFFFLHSLFLVFLLSSLFFCFLTSTTTTTRTTRTTRTTGRARTTRTTRTTRRARTTRTTRIARTTRRTRIASKNNKSNKRLKNNHVHNEGLKLRTKLSLCVPWGAAAPPHAPVQRFVFCCFVFSFWYVLVSLLWGKDHEAQTGWDVHDPVIYVTS